MYCIKCGAMQFVVSSLTQWYWKCLDCGIRKNYPGSKQKGLLAAIRHRQKTSHAVEFRDGTDRLLWSSVRWTQEQLSLDNDAAPF